MPISQSELAAVTALLIGFIRDLTPDPNSTDNIEVPVETLSALATLAKSFTPHPERLGEADELAFITEKLEELCQSHSPS